MAGRGDGALSTTTKRRRCSTGPREVPGPVKGVSNLVGKVHDVRAGVEARVQLFEGRRAEQHAVVLT